MLQLQTILLITQFLHCQNKLAVSLSVLAALISAVMEVSERAVLQATPRHHESRL
jgi:hypothetical protein